MPPMATFRVATGGFSHETNTFNPAPTTLERIKTHGFYLEGQAVLDYHADTNTTIGGFIDGAREHGLELIPTFFATHGPHTGRIDDAVVHHVTERLVEGIAAAKADGVLLHLHGAAAGGDISDPEAHILTAVREAIGPDVPLVLVYDLHANIGPTWAEEADAIIGYKTAPHTDLAERGVEGAPLMKRPLAGEGKPDLSPATPPTLAK